jgi:hypothetical protein
MSTPANNDEGNSFADDCVRLIEKTLEAQRRKAAVHAVVVTTLVAAPLAAAAAPVVLAGAVLCGLWGWLDS